MTVSFTEWGKPGGMGQVAAQHARNPLILARPERFELPTPWFVARDEYDERILINDIGQDAPGSKLLNCLNRLKSA